MSDLVKLYNPANSGALTQEQIEGLQKLTSAEIKELAQAYPNGSTGYLLIVDSRKEISKQLPTLSTFQNLYNLRERNGQKHFVAYNFKGNYKPVTVLPTKARKTEVRDLSDEELLTLPGFKAAAEKFPEETVVVKKIRKKKEKPE